KIAKFLSEETNAKQEDIVLVPLIENVEIMKEINSFYKQYLDEIRSSCGDREGYRIFLGKSDVSLQCGHVASTLAIKKAIYQLWTVNNPPSVILGVGGPPIRGGLLPSLLYHFIENYGGVSTITIQSALRYDHGRNEYAETVGTLRKWINCPPQEITTEINSVIDHASREYQKDLSRVMNGVMTVTPFIPSRRERLTHENYGRVVAGYVLPRAIRFACALYSIGLPPSLLGISILLRNDFPHDIHNFKAELSFDLSFFVPEVAQHYIGHENTSYFVDIVRQLRKEFGIDSTPIPGYENLLMKGIEKPADLSTYLTRAATMRGFLG
ncbi:MAG: phosphoenolpyruvate carboxylase, partial [Candidatus Methanomethylicaceae archaeon]